MHILVMNANTSDIVTEMLSAAPAERELVNVDAAIAACFAGANGRP